MIPRDPSNRFATVVRILFLQIHLAQPFLPCCEGYDVCHGGVDHLILEFFDCARSVGTDNDVVHLMDSFSRENWSVPTPGGGGEELIAFAEVFS